VRAIARTPDRIPAALRARVEIVAGDYTDPAIVAKAFEGARAVFWLMLGDQRATDVQAAFVDATRPAAAALRAHGVAQVVTVSALGRDWPHAAGHAAASRRMDDLIAQTGVSLRALACPSLMENVLRQVAGIATRGVYFGVAPHGQREPLCACADVATVAADLLADPAWRGVADVPLLGAEDISGAEMAATMTDVLGQPVAYREMAIADLCAGMIARGASPGMAQAMAEMMAAKIAGIDRAVPRDAANTTPTRFRDWCATVLKQALRA
jgi:uncharacterized protein YbjT (DUF2867 family)